MTDRELLVLTTRALDLLANVEAGSDDERLIWYREVQPALDAALAHLSAPAPAAHPETTRWPDDPEAP